jgi:hypothetical protein
VVEPPSPLPKKDGKERKEGEKKTEEEDEEEDFIVLDHPTIPTPEQIDELEQFERAMYIDTT